MGIGEVEEGKGWWKGVRVFTPEYHALCAVGGMLSAGTTHLAITPLDVFKVNMQVQSMIVFFLGLNILVKEHGPSSLWRGWAGKFFGYALQGGCKLGLYEYFKKIYSDVLAGYNRSIIFFVSSASAQVIADVALCPFEAVKVHVQTTQVCKVFVLMFSSFEHTVDILYHNVIQRKREDCSRAQLLGVTCIAGYTSGAAGTIVSNPADDVAASLYNKKASNVFQTVKCIGFPSLFTRSLLIRFALVGPVITMQWFFYDTISIN